MNNEYNFEVIPNEQTPKVDAVTNTLTLINDNREVFEAYLDYAIQNTSAVGLAANQTSLNGERFMQRVFALRNIYNPHLWSLVINPTLKHVGMFDTKIEGCLTWKDKLIIAERSRAVDVCYYDMDGNYHEATYKGFEAQVWQHEINHLDGIEENVQDLSYPIPKPIEIQRNEKCPCGSEIKYKNCCLKLI